MSDNQSVKLPTFDGKAKKFTMFWMRFKAYAAVKGFLPALQDGGEGYMPPDEATVLDPSDPDEKLMIEAKKRNAVAVASLTMAFTTQALMKHVNKACDEDWPSGLAHKIVKSLFNKYRPKDNISKVELRMMLNKVSMKPKDNPEKLFEQLAEIQNYDEKGSIDEEDLMAVVFTVAPKQYQSVLSAVQLEKKDKLTLEDLEEAMDQVWRQGSALKFKQREDDENSDEELALAAQDNKPKKKNYRFKGECNRCGKYGHKAKDCWTDPRNASKRPEGYRVPEVSTAATDGGEKISKELQLVNISWDEYAKAFAEEDDIDFEKERGNIARDIEGTEKILKMVTESKELEPSTVQPMSILQGS
eukprot:scaffold7386_cov160-Amphora_coffeaeformis.AAC.9